VDRFDHKIIAALQQDSSQPLATLAERIGLSSSACHRRVRALESEGVITGYSARIEPSALGFTLLVFVEITLSSQALDVLEAFEAAVQDMDDILECHLTSGAADYILRVVARDMEDYARIHRNRLARLPHVSNMQTIFTLRPVKRWRGYPLGTV
jgi:DNA-binding Lrp family transcriptional regulator